MKDWTVSVNEPKHFTNVLRAQYTTINKLLNNLTAQIGLRSSPVQGIDKVHIGPLGNAARNTGVIRLPRSAFFLWRKARVKKTGMSRDTIIRLPVN